MLKTVLAALSLMCWATAAYPCSCRHVPIETNIDRAAHVFRARVTSAELVRLEPGAVDEVGGAFVKAHVDVLATLKGNPDRLDAVYTRVDSSACGVPIVLGLEYVFFLSPLGLATICGGTLQRGVSFMGSDEDWLQFVQRYGLAPISPDHF